MPNTVDYVLIAAIVAWAAYDHFVFMPRFARATAAGTPGARGRAYGGIAFGEWMLTAAIVVAWLHAHRPLGSLGLALPAGGRLLGTIVLVAVFGALVVLQTRQIAALTPARRAKAAAKLARPLVALMPHTRGERNGFMLLSVTAGICEELIARGYLIWFFAAWTGPWLALPIASVLFGLGHAYQGRSGILKTGAVGLVLGVFYLATGSLLAGIVIHTLIDVGSGLAGYALVAAPEPEPDEAPAA